MWTTDMSIGQLLSCLSLLCSIMHPGMLCPGTLCPRPLAPREHYAPGTLCLRCIMPPDQPRITVLQEHSAPGKPQRDTCLGLPNTQATKKPTSCCVLSAEVSPESVGGNSCGMCVGKLANNLVQCSEWMEGWVQARSRRSCTHGVPLCLIDVQSTSQSTQPFGKMYPINAPSTPLI